MAKKKKNPKKPVQRWKLYQVSGNKLERKNKFCPKCGSSVFMGQHKNRSTCGKCSYSEIISSENKSK